VRKKDILSNFVKNPDVFYTHEIRKLDSKNEAYSALITFLPGSRKLLTDIDGKQVNLSAPDCKCLMYLPLDEYWKIAVGVSPENELVEWYFDISSGNYLDDSGMPCIDDLYLDLIVQPSGKTITLDADELQEALDKNLITPEDYNHAYMVHDQILNSKWSDVAFLTGFSEKLLEDYS